MLLLKLSILADILSIQIEFLYTNVKFSVFVKKCHKHKSNFAANVMLDQLI